MVGIMSFFADFTYEGSRSITGPYLGMLGAGAFTISVISGAGEFLGYNIRLFSGRGADRTGRYWPITIGGYVLQMSVVPLLALAGNWQVAALLIIAERIGKGIRNPPRDAMLSHAAKDIGYGWAFGVHEALDQFGALFGPLLVALVLVREPPRLQDRVRGAGRPGRHHVVAAGVARLLYPRPQDLATGPAQVTTEGCRGCSGCTWAQRRWPPRASPTSRSSPTTSSTRGPCRPRSRRCSTRSRWR